MRYALLSVLFLIAGFFGFIMAKPNVSTSVVSIVINTEPDVVFNLINNQKNWPRWSPWARIDQNMTKTFEGSQEGVGSIYRWSSENKEVGTGSQIITESIKNSKIKFDITFDKPFKGEVKSEFEIAADKEVTLITWKTTMEHKTFICKAFYYLLNVKKDIDKKLSDGLINLKQISESSKNKSNKSDGKKNYTHRR